MTKMRIPNSLSAGGDNQLTPGCAVTYEHNGNPILGAVLEFKKPRFLTINESGQELLLDANRLHRLPREPRLVTADRKEKIALLQSLRQDAEQQARAIKLSELWQLVGQEERGYTNAGLAELLPGEASITKYLGLRLLLLTDKVYFKRKDELFTPRPAGVVEELLRVEAAQRERERQLKVTLDAFAARAANRDAILPPESATGIRLLEDLAADIQPGEHGAQREERRFLEECEHRLRLSPRTRLDERAFAVLEAIAHFHPDTNLALIRHRPPIEFSPPALEESLHVAQLPLREEAHREDLRSWLTFTIDDRSTRDMDDALSIEELPNGRVRLGIHISDVAAHFPANTALDGEARKRATSIYLPERTLHMLPEPLSTSKISLCAGEARDCLSTIIECDRSLENFTVRITPSRIVSARKLSYDEADQILELPPHDTLSEKLHLLHELAAASEAWRITNDASGIPKRDVQVVLKENGDFELVQIDENSPARALVAEMMVIANRFAAAYAVEHGIPMVFRGQQPPQGVAEIKSRGIPQGPALDFALRGCFSRSVTGIRPQPHAGLGLRAYVQLTSPIRRFHDLVNQRQLKAAIAGSALPYSEEELLQLIGELEEPLARALSLSRESKRYWLLKALRRKLRETISAPVVRNDLRFPLVLIDELQLTLTAKCARKVKLGEIIKVKVTAVDPRSDYVRLEEV